VREEERKRKERRGVECKTLWELGIGSGKTLMMTFTGTTLCVHVPSSVMQACSMGMHDRQSLQVAILSLNITVVADMFDGKVLRGMVLIALIVLASVPCSPIARVCFCKD